MPFQPGNDEAKKADHRRPKIITQQLIAALNETAANRDISKLRAVVNALIDRAQEGDIQAINTILDRVEGKVPQAIAGEDGTGPVRILVDTGIVRA